VSAGSIEIGKEWETSMNYLNVDTD
jgi:hypothetical protein